MAGGQRNTRGGSGDVLVLGCCALIMVPVKTEEETREAFPSKKLLGGVMFLEVFYFSIF